MLLNSLQINLNMLKTRHTVSSLKVNKRIMRPPSATTTLHHKSAHPTPQINNILYSLERNVKDLKTFYHHRQEPRLPSTNTKHRGSIRLKKVLRRDSSRSNLRQQSQQQTHRQSVLPCEKSLADVFELRSYFQRVNGRQTNNIVELFQFYKKNIEKRDKSTRILASMDMSNPMGLSLDVGKQSLLKHQILQYQHRPQIRQQEAEQKKLSSSDRYEYGSKLELTLNKHKQGERTSNLANQLISKGLYNIANVTNLMMNKKFKLTRQKEESFQLAKQREHINNKKPQITKQNSPAYMNQVMPSEVQMIQKINQMKNSLQKIQRQKTSNFRQSQPNKSHELNHNYSFEENVVVVAQQPISKSKNSNKKSKCSVSPVKSFEISSIKKKQHQTPKINQFSGLDQSPIPNKDNDFVKSKYYVQPIPMPQRRPQDQKSISLQCNSKIIDVDLLPFDL